MRSLEIFEQDYINNTPVTGVTYPKSVNYTVWQYEENIKQVEKYYNDRKFSVKNTNLISRILEVLPLHLNYDTYNYSRFLDAKAPYIGKHFKLTSDLESGIVHIGEFFGFDDEIIFSVDMGLSPIYVVKNWQNICAVKIYKHNRNDTKLLLPFGNDDGGRSGLSVIGIDLKVLALQYREYVKEHIRTNTPFNKNMFVVKYVISKTIGDVIDGVFLNRVMDIYYGREVVTPKFKHSFKIRDRQDLVDTYADWTVKILKQKKNDYVNILHGIKLIKSFNAAEYCVLPDLIGTSQSETFMVMSRLDIMCFLIDLRKDNNNQHFINDFKRAVKRIKNDSYLKQNFSHVVYTDIKNKIQKILEA